MLDDKQIDSIMKELFHDLFDVRSKPDFCYTVTTNRSFNTIELRGTGFYFRNWKDYYLK